MAVIRYKHRTDLDKSGRKKKKKAPAPPPTSAKFKKLAKKRGVDLPAEQARARGQLERGERVGGTTPQTLALQAKLPQAPPPTPSAAPPAAPQQTFQQSATDPFQQGADITPFTTAAAEAQPLIQRKLEQIRAQADKPIIGFSGEPLNMKELTPFDALALVNIPARPFTSLFGKELPSIAATKFAAGTGAVRNLVTRKFIKSAAAKISGSVTWKVLGALGLAAWIAEKILKLTYEGKNFGQFLGQEEAAQAINIAAATAYYAGNEEAYNLAKEARDEILANDEYWDSISSLTPIENVATGLDRFRDTAIVAGEVMDKVAADKFAAIESGETEVEQWQRAQADRAAMEKANIEFFNEQRLITEAQLRAANEEQRNKDAIFWRGERDKQRKQELENAKAIADFWLQYQKMKQKLIEDNRPSNLNFGLI